MGGDVFQEDLFVRHLRDGEGIAKCSGDDVIQFFMGYRNITEHRTSEVTTKM